MTDFFNSLCGNNTASAQESLIRHLEHILNTRKGSLIHLPQYGLSDLSQVYDIASQDDGIEKLKEEIKRNLEEYGKVVVLELEQSPRPDRSKPSGFLVFHIKCQAEGIGELKFQTTLEQNGYASLNKWVRP